MNIFACGYCSSGEISKFLNSKDKIAVLLRRNCSSPSDLQVWSEEKINDSFSSFQSRFNCLINNGYRISGSFVMSKEEEVEYFSLLHYLRLMCMNSVSFQTDSFGKEYISYQDGFNVDFFKMIFVIRSGLICVNTPLIENFCSKLNCSESICGEAKSECVFALIKSVEMFDPFKCNRFSTYAFTSFRNTFNDFITKRRNQNKTISSLINSKSKRNFECSEIPDDHVSDIKEIIEIAKKNPSSFGLSDIELKCVLYVISDEDKNLDEKACELGISRGTFKNRTISALNKIKEIIIEDDKVL